MRATWASARSPSRVPTRRIPEPAAAAPSGGKPWLVIVLLLAIGGIAGAILVERANERANKNAQVAAAPAAAPPVASPIADTIAAVKQANADENAKLKQEVDEARAAALAAEHQVELLSRAQKSKSGAASASKAGGGSQAPVVPAEPPHAHIIVLARGGTPRVFVDGQPTVNAAPTVLEVPPGQHVVSVRGATGNVFTPAEYNLTLAPDDTQQVVFVSQRAAQYQLRRRQTFDSARTVKRPR